MNCCVPTSELRFSDPSSSELYFSLVWKVPNCVYTHLSNFFFFFLSSFLSFFNQNKNENLYYFWSSVLWYFHVKIFVCACQRTIFVKHILKKFKIVYWVRDQTGLDWGKICMIPERSLLKELILTKCSVAHENRGSINVKFRKYWTITNQKIIEAASYKPITAIYTTFNDIFNPLLSVMNFDATFELSSVSIISWEIRYETSTCAM